MLFLLMPAGMENLIREMSVPAGSRTIPPPATAAPDFERIRAIAAAHGAELLA
jgi:hypothetical protein